jgi:hypothetical protein
MLHSRDDTPHINMHGAPPDQQGEIRLLNDALRDMHTYTRDFNSAVDLFENAQRLSSGTSHQDSSRVIEWQFIAARDGVMSIFHFRNEMLAANNLANTLQHVVPQLNRRFLGEAHSLFTKLFPDFLAIRHAVAHAGELSKNKSSEALHNKS